jgi:hypothetical protein
MRPAAPAWKTNAILMAGPSAVAAASLALAGALQRTGVQATRAAGARARHDANGGSWARRAAIALQSLPESVKEWESGGMAF